VLVVQPGVIALHQVDGDGHRGLRFEPLASPGIGSPLRSLSSNSRIMGAVSYDSLVRPRYGLMRRRSRRGRAARSRAPRAWEARGRLTTPSRGEGTFQGAAHVEGLGSIALDGALGTTGAIRLALKDWLTGLGLLKAGETRRERIDFIASSVTGEGLPCLSSSLL